MEESKKHNILVVDDSKIILNKMKRILGSFGYCVDTAEGGKEGISKVLSRKPDLLLLDIEMPDIDGFEVFRQVRAQEKFQVLPVIIFFTGHSTKKVKGLRLGASDFIAKQLASNNPEEFHARIHSHLKIADLMRKNVELEKLSIIEATSTSARHEIFQPLSVISVEASSILNRKDQFPECKHCVSALKQIKKSVTKITQIVQGFSEVKTSETVKYAGGGNMLARSEGKNFKEKK